MAPKKKISSVKKTNQLHTKLNKQGKLKNRRHKKKTMTKREGPAQQVYSDEEEGDGLPAMDDNDMIYLTEAVNNRSYSFLTGANLLIDDPLKKSGKRKNPPDEANSNLEEKYEKNNLRPLAKKQKMLLPIKTAEGFVTRTEDLESDVETEEQLETGTIPTKVVAAVDNGSTLRQFTGRSEISTSELLAGRHRELQKKKFRIGLLCSALLESPESKIGNFKSLLELMEERDPLLRITVRKIVMVSLVEVFKDLIPSYQIKHSDDSNIKLKKDVRQMHDYENNLLRAYKSFLQKLEKSASILRRKKGDTRVFKKAELNLAELALQSLCDLLREHLHFNYTKNIIHLVIPFLNNNNVNAREMVSKCVKSIFKCDIRGEVSLEHKIPLVVVEKHRQNRKNLDSIKFESQIDLLSLLLHSYRDMIVLIARSINKLVKSKGHNINPASLEVFLHLKLKDVNLDSEKENKLKDKKLQSKKGNILRLSKRERKREKRLKELNQELLETKAVESNKSKIQNLTEITKIVFALYFKTLKVAPSSKLLNAALEGIAKFAHCINIDFYHDLINVLDHLIENESLGYKEQLRCVQTVFAILSYQGATINIDPIRFYTHFYTNLLNVHAGKTHGDLALVLSAADSVLIKRRKHLSLQRLLAFTKRLATLSLQTLPNGSLGLLTLVRQVLQLSKASGVLLDTESSFGKGSYQPELEEPEYCNAGATALYDLLPLQRHYHPSLRQYATYVLSLGGNSREVTPAAASFLKKDPCELFKEYDASEVKFVPPVPPPRPTTSKHRPTGVPSINNAYLKEYVKETLNRI